MSPAGYSSSGMREERALQELVCRVAARVLDGMVGEITAETPLTPEYGVDSLAFVEIIELVESEASSLLGRTVAIDDAQFQRLRTVGDVAGYLAGTAEGG